MLRFHIILNGFKIGKVFADTEELALKQAIYLYGLTVDVEEIL